MKDSIDQHLNKLIGFQLTSTSRAANMECFKFGHLEKQGKGGGSIQIGQFALHIQCPWRISDGTAILVGYFNMYEPKDQYQEVEEPFNWDTVGGNIRDYRLQELIRTKELIVQSVQGDSLGGFDLFFSSGIVLSVFPASSLIDEYAEYWRLLDNCYPQKEHIVSGWGV